MHSPSQLEGDHWRQSPMVAACRPPAPAAACVEWTPLVGMFHDKWLPLPAATARGLPTISLQGP